ncbi:CDP-glycerol glycerophosphotransferase family protein [Virgibacillus sp. W0430]|uniref:CDP-glycerol glycerophosphotransferase family protein n=1 Tax=Virgibacillus sp. W0430 TaxID=3391580 RepID=UPI003F46CABA
MARELSITIYLFVFRTFFTLFKMFPLKNKTVCVASFGDNIFYTAQSLKNDSPEEEIVILKSSTCKYPFNKSLGKIIPFQTTRPIAFLHSIYHLATARTILVDNYFGFLAVTAFREDVTCIQLWHAAGAIKQFGLKDPSTKMRSVKANERFQKVYDRFDYVVVGSEKMAGIFGDSFGLSHASILRTGIPRTDVFFNKQKQLEIVQQLYRAYPALNQKRKKVIVYAPTFRKDGNHHLELELEIQKLYDAFSNEYILVIKHHPSAAYRLNEKYSDFVYDVSDYYDINHFLFITDILITDYSSIPFEFALLEKPMIFYAYDMDAYKKSSGLIAQYESIMPGPVVCTTEGIIEAIKKNEFDRETIKRFAKDWNEYSRGKSSENLVRFLTATEEQERAFG